MSDRIFKEGPGSWSGIKKKREEMRKKYPSIFKIPIIYSTKRMLIKNTLRDFNGKLLDIGAGDRFVGEICSDKGRTIEYKSMDADRTRSHEYYALEEISEKFNGIMLLDVIEHLSLEEGFKFLKRISELLEPGGKIFLTVPNNFHPTAFFVDCTHITSYRCHDLGALLSLLGFEDVQIFRVSAKRKIKHRIFAVLLRPVMKWMDIDFATGIFITARKDS
ncbi:MAG TPA: methyltransferase domain-containing protein [Nitrospirae bacterium]|nr:methyltransferase domain-containing protein [Nitrospirota bacterium]HDO26180.1 methyltransferase domain-containing protein [Nitrospirota bacterium]